MAETLYKRFADAIAVVEYYSYEQRESKEIALAFLVLRYACIKVDVVELGSKFGFNIAASSLVSQDEEDFFSNFMSLVRAVDSIFFIQDNGVSEVFEAFVEKNRRAKEVIASIKKIYEVLFFETVDGKYLAGIFESVLLELYNSKGGGGPEFYTPRNLVDFAVELVNPENNEKIYDPVCGTGGFLVRANDYLHQRNSNVCAEFIGRDKSLFSVKISFWNLYIHGVDNFSVYTGDSLSWAQYDPRKYDVVLANPPFSVKDWNWNLFASSGMDFYGAPPRANADYAFLLHIIFSLSDMGRAAVIVPSGVLFRGGAEKEIRRNIVNDGLIEMVVSLPAGLIKGTSVSLCMIFFNKRTRSESVFFARAPEKLSKDQFVSPAFELSNILDICREKRSVKGCSESVSIADIAKKEFDLSVSRYVVSGVAEIRGVAEVAEEYIKLEAELRSLQDELKYYLDRVLD